MKASALGAVFLALTAPVAAVPTRRASPTIMLDSGTFVGTSSGNANKFLGIPFAQPPVGDLRFNLPKPVDPYAGTYTVTSDPPGCPQQAFTVPIPAGLAQDSVDYIVNSVYGTLFPGEEDCLTVSVVTPASATPDSKLPVLAWIFGGGFEFGTTSQYDGATVVEQSISMNQSVVYVSMNYRVSAFGFLAGKEVKEASVGNLGLQDQRLALRWIQKYVTAFGGDPEKVTIWGESAGATSVALHMITNGGDAEGLFRAGFMESGSPFPVGDLIDGQSYYDDIVSRTGCSGSSDTLQCLREVPYDTLKNAVDQSPSLFAYQSLKLAYLPRVDGAFLTKSPQQLVIDGSVASIPFITGDCDDEGTLFSLGNLNVTTDDAIHEYFKDIIFPGSTVAEIDQVLAAYPSDITQGSPYDTGVLNALTPQFKRIAAIEGDIVFQAPRRFFLQQRSAKQNTWAFLNKRLKWLPALGSAHATDLLNAYGGGDMAAYLIRFAANLDPNGGSSLSWPKYTTDSPKLLTFLDGLTPEELSEDTYRTDGFNVLTDLLQKYPI